MKYDDTVKVAIDQNEMDELILDLYNQIDTITSILNKIKYKIVDINDYFTGNVANAYQQRLNKYVSQMGLIKDNLNAYTTDLMTIKNYFRNVDLSGARKLADKQDVIEERVTALGDAHNNVNTTLNINPANYQ